MSANANVGEAPEICRVRALWLGDETQGFTRGALPVGPFATVCAEPGAGWRVRVHLHGVLVYDSDDFEWACGTHGLHDALRLGLSEYTAAVGLDSFGDGETPGEIRTVLRDAYERRVRRETPAPQTAGGSL